MSTPDLPNQLSTSQVTWKEDCQIPDFQLSWDEALQFSSVQLLSCLRLFVTPWITAHQASLSITTSQSSLRLMSIESVMPCNLVKKPPPPPPPPPPKLSGFSKQTRRLLSKSNHLYIFLHFFYGQPCHLQIKKILFWKRYFKTYLAALDLLWWAGSLVVAYMLSCPASLIRDRTHVPCIGRWILFFFFFNFILFLNFT